MHKFSARTEHYSAEGARRPDADPILVGAQAGAMVRWSHQEVVQGLLQQIADALVVFSTAVEVPESAALRVWLQPHARAAEAAMHRLRELGLARSSAATELSQSLTVLVLVADMLVHGQFAELDDGLALLRRNAVRAARCLFEMRAHLAHAR